MHNSPKIAEEDSALDSIFDASLESVQRGFLDHVLHSGHKPSIKPIVKQTRQVFVKALIEHIEDKRRPDGDVNASPTLKAATNMMKHLKGISEELNQVKPPLMRFNRLRTHSRDATTRPPQNRCFQKRRTHEKEKGNAVLMRLVSKTPGESPKNGPAKEVAFPKIAAGAATGWGGFGLPKKSLPEVLLTPLGSDIRNKHTLTRSISVLQFRVPHQRKLRRKSTRLKNFPEGSEKRLRKIGKLYSAAAASGCETTRTSTKSNITNAFIEWGHAKLVMMSARASPTDNSNRQHEKLKTVFTKSHYYPFL